MRAAAPSASPSLCAHSSRPRLPPCPAVRFRPCIDLHHGLVKQIVGSTLSDDASPSQATRALASLSFVLAHLHRSSPLLTNFETTISAADFARRYAADGLPGGHVILLSPDEPTRAAALAALAAFPGGLQARTRLCSALVLPLR